MSQHLPIMAYIMTHTEKQRFEYVGQAYTLVKRLVAKNLQPKYRDSIHLAVSDSYLYSSSPNAFEHLTHVSIMGLAKLPTPFRYEKGQVSLVNNPYISVGHRFEGSGSLYIGGTIRTRYRGYRKHHFNECDFIFIPYVYIIGTDYTSLEMRVKWNKNVFTGLTGVEKL